MTIMEMFQQGMVSHLIIMGILFILMGIMISAIGGEISKMQKKAVNDSTVNNSNVTEDMPAITAAITAAINEYRKNN